MAHYDGKYLKLTDRYKAALHELMEAEMEMMLEADPVRADSWK